MRRILLGAVAFAAGATMACESPSAPGAAEGPGLEPDGRAAFSVNPAIDAHASGAAHRDALGAPVILNFSAVKYADGTVRGEYYFRALGTDPDQMIRTRVTCMTVIDGNRAWIGGIIEDSHLRALIGSPAFFHAVDNGEGANAEEDLITRVAVVVGGAGQEQAFCANAPALPANIPPIDVVRGNVNIDGREG